MADDADLASQDHALTELGRTADAALSYQQAEGTDFHVVRDLHQVVDLGAAADDGLAQSRSVDAGAGADLDIVFDAHDPRLGDLAVHRALAVAFQIQGETESVAAHDAIRL